MNDHELRDMVIRALTEVAPDVDPTTIEARHGPHRAARHRLDGLLNIIVAIHEQTGIEIPERDYPKLSTLNDAIAYLDEAQMKGASSSTSAGGLSG